MRAVLVSVVFTLAGCAGQVEEPEPRIVRVEVPVVAVAAPVKAVAAVQEVSGFTALSR